MPEDEVKNEEQAEQMDYVADQADLDNQRYERAKAESKSDSLFVYYSCVYCSTDKCWC